MKLRYFWDGYHTIKMYYCCNPSSVSYIIYINIMFESFCVAYKGQVLPHIFTL